MEKSREEGEEKNQQSIKNVKMISTKARDICTWKERKKNGS